MGQSTQETVLKNYKTGSMVYVTGVEYTFHQTIDHIKKVKEKLSQIANPLFGKFVLKHNFPLFIFYPIKDFLVQKF